MNIPLTPESIRQYFLGGAQVSYKKFSSSLLPGTENILGIRLPLIRAVAADITAKTDWRQYLRNAEDYYFEEIMLRGFIISKARCPLDEKLALIQEFVPKIDNWSVCDSFCSSLKFTAKNKEAVRAFLTPYFSSTNEFELRFAFVMLLFHFVDEQYIEDNLRKIDAFRSDCYYSRMACAWALSVCFVKFPEKSLAYLELSTLDSWTFNKALSKICESYRVSAEMKEKVKLLKK